MTALQVLINLGAVETEQGTFDEAREHLLEAVTIAFGNDQISLGAAALANLAYVETTQGNLPEAFDAFASAEDGLRRTDSVVDLPRVHADHALALADANLLDDAEHLIDRAVELSAAGGNDLELAELLLVSAEIDLAKGKPDEAHVSAVNAVVAFTRQGRDGWLHVAERLRLRAEARLTPDAPGDRRRVGHERTGVGCWRLAVRRRWRRCSSRPCCTPSTDGSRKRGRCSPRSAGRRRAAEVPTSCCSVGWRRSSPCAAATAAPPAVPSPPDSGRPPQVRPRSDRSRLARTRPSTAPS